jgi:hypothetical protein
VAAADEGASQIKAFRFRCCCCTGEFRMVLAEGLLGDRQRLLGHRPCLLVQAPPTQIDRGPVQQPANRFPSYHEPLAVPGRREYVGQQSFTGRPGRHLPALVRKALTHQAHRGLGPAPLSVLAKARLLTTEP